MKAYARKIYIYKKTWRPFEEKIYYDNQNAGLILQGQIKCDAESVSSKWATDWTLWPLN